MAVGRRMRARSRSGFCCQTIELGFWTPTGLVVAFSFSEWAEAALPLEGQASCRRALVGSGRRDAARLDAEGRNKSSAASELKSIHWREACGFTRLAQSTAAAVA